MCHRFRPFLDVAGKPVLYARGHYEWSVSEIEKLNHDGFSVLFYQKTDDEKVSNLRSTRSIRAEDEEDLSEENKLVVGQILDNYKDWVLRLQAQDGKISSAHGIAESLVSSLKNNSQLALGFRCLSNHDSYSFYHSIRTAAYSAVIAGAWL